MRHPDEELESLEAENLRRHLRVIEGPQGSSVDREGRTVLNFSSNDYLGLAAHPRLKAAFQEAVARWGAGSGASRLISGTARPHVDLEEKIAGLKSAEAALTFSSGYATATGTIPAIVGKDDVVVLDKLCHASLIDGARLSGATLRVFPHNDLDKLRRLVAWGRDRTGSEGRVLVVTESIFSMDGDRAPLAEIVGIARSCEALLFVDEAHALGVLGPQGRGLAAELGLEREIDFQMGTLSKAAGLSGGYLCASRCWIELILNRARSLIYSTAPSPALAATASVSLDLITGSEGRDLRDRLWNRVRQLDPAAASAIVPVILGSNERALHAGRILEEKGFWVPAIRFPTVPRNTARLRITLTAVSRAEEVDRLREILDDLR